MSSKGVCHPLPSGYHQMSGRLLAIEAELVQGCMLPLPGRVTFAWATVCREPIIASNRPLQFAARYSGCYQERE